MPSDIDAFEASAPLTSAQARMWFLSRLQPDACAYTVATGLRFETPLDGAAIRMAAIAVCRDVDVLRARFVEEDGIPAMRIAQADGFEPDLRYARAKGDVERFVVTRLQAAMRFAFDLAAGAPPCWFELIEADGGVVALIVCQHHVVTDGWSLSLLADRLAAAYGAAWTGTSLVSRPSRFSAIAKTPAPIASESLGFWTELLGGAPALPLAFARPRPSTQRFMGASQTLAWPETVADRIAALTREHRTTPYVVTLALVGGFLGRLCEQDDFVLGTPHANRTEPDHEETLGLFVNSFGVRIRPAASTNLSALIAGLHDQVMTAFDHLDTPLEAVVEALGLDRALSHNPLFQVMVAYQSTMRAPPAFNGVASSWVRTEGDNARFDLEWTFFPDAVGGGYRLTWNSDLFAAADMARLARLFEGFVATWTAAPSRSLAAIDLVDPAAPTPHVRTCPACFEDALTPVHALFSRQASRTPDRLALSSSRGAHTYAELDGASDRLASRLVARGLAPGDVVATLLPRSPTIVVAILAIFKAGLTLLPLDPSQPRARWSRMRRDAGARLLLTSSHAAGDAPLEAVESLQLTEDEIFSPTAWAALDTRPEAVAAEATAYIIYTSGTTGTPKGVRVRHRNLVNTLLATQVDFGLNVQDVAAVMAPVGFDIFFFELLSPLLVGGEARLVEPDEWLDPSALRAIFDRITVCQAVPGMMRGILNALDPGRNYPAMREITTGGDRVPPRLLDELAIRFPSARVTVTYGPTETAILATRHVHVSPARGHPIGAPLANVRIRISDAAGRIVPDGVEGEIEIGGAGVAEGYHQRLEETTARFVWRDGEPFYATGDRGRWRDDGGLEFCGRRDDQLKVRGFRVELGEIEAALASHPAVSQAVVTAVADQQGDARLSAFIVPHPQTQVQGSVGSDSTVGEWGRLFDFIHDGDESLLAGWHQSHDGRPIAEETMGLWRAATLDRIGDLLATGPATGPPKVLEIGCGTGLLLAALAPSCAIYDATDLSAVIVDQVRARASRAGLDQVHVVCAPAHAKAFAHEVYDLVILNSVVQYFPNEAYLERVLANALARLKPGGSLFIGDIRALHLAPRFYRFVAEQRAAGDAARVRGEASRLRAGEHELLLHPQGLERALSRIAPAATLSISPKLAGRPNEITCFRFDAVITTGARLPERIDWVEPPSDLAAGIRAVRATVAPASVTGWMGVANAWFSPTKPGATTPEQVVEVATALGLRAQVSWLGAAKDGAFDVALSDAAALSPPIVWPANTAWDGPTSNRPMSREQLLRFEHDLRSHLKARLPSYMLPSALELLAEIPLTPHGKFDRQALPATPVRRSAAAGPPRGPIEEAIADVWAEVLRLGARPARDDNFFHLGGTSLSAIRVAAKLRLQAFDLKPQLLFTEQTIAELALALTQTDKPEPARPMALAPPVAGERQRSGRQPLAKSSAVLLTGATGYLGAHLLRSLLVDGQARILCPIRSTDDSHAMARLRDTMAWYFADDAPGLIQVLERRCAPFAADLANGAGTWSAYPPPSVAQHIFHAAADVRHVAPVQDTWRANVEGVRAVLTLAERWNATVHHVSSVGVAGIWPNETRPPPHFLESDGDVGQRLTEPYSESKMAAEMEVRGFQARGGHATIYRSSTIAPHSATGHFQRNIADHFLSRYLRATVELGFALDRPERILSLVPVDVMAEWILGLADEPGGARAFHLISRHTVSYTQLVERLKASGYDVKLLSRQAFRHAASARGDADAALGVVFKSTDVNAVPSLPIDATWSWSAIDRLMLRDPAPSESWFERFLDHARVTGLLPATKRRPNARSRKRGEACAS